MADASYLIAGAALGMADSALSRYNGNTMGLIGDSLFGLGFDAATMGIGSSVWPHQMMMNSGGRIKFGYNAGISGQRTDQMVARFQTDIIDRRPSFVIICGGTNDYIQGYSVSSALKNIETMVTMALPERITPILSTIPPRDAGGFLEVQQHNAGIRKLSQKYGLHVLDIHSILVDPSNGKYKPEYTSDGIHYNVAAGKVIGHYAANELIPKLPAFSLDLPVMNSGARNLLKNSLFLLDTDSNGVPDTWTYFGSGVATSTIVTGDSNIKGNWLVMEKTDTAADKTYQQQSLTGWSPGDRIAFMGRFRTTLESGAGRVNAQLDWTGASGFIRPLNAWQTNNEGVFNVEAVIPAGVTALTVKLTFGSGTGKVEYAQLGLYNLTTDPY